MEEASGYSSNIETSIAEDLSEQFLRISQRIFFQGWLSRQDLKKIDTLFAQEEMADSTIFYNFLKGLVSKQKNIKPSAQFKEAHGGSHKLAVLVSETGKKILFPFAHHPGNSLDRNSRNLLIDGFKELFGIS